MAIDLGLQLWTVRDLCAKDLPGTLKMIADIGYKSIQPAGYYGYRPSEFKKIADDCGLKINSAHALCCSTNWGEVMDIADILGVKTIGACVGSTDDYATVDKIKASADKINAQIEAVEKHGFEVFLHNHYWEFERIDGKLKYDYLQELCPKLKCELDLYWATNYFTEDPVAILKKYAYKTTLLHLKDGIGHREGDQKTLTMMPLGRGKLPIPELVANAPACCREIYVELDECNVPIPEAIKISYDYMIRNGFATGNK